MTGEPNLSISGSLGARSDGRTGSLDLCRASTKSGRPCTLPPEPDSGLCRHQHDPRWAEERAARNALAASGIATRASATPDEVVVKWADHLDWSTPELLATSLQEAAGFMVARALSTKQGETFAKLADGAAKVRGWPLPATAQAPTYNVVMTDYSAKKPAEATEP